MAEDGRAAARHEFLVWQGSSLPKLIGLVCALVALAASILSKVDAGPALLRSAIAYFAGSLLTQAWYVFFATRIANVDEIDLSRYSEPSGSSRRDADKQEAA
jgi:hypothetical protein